jgi:hypothetical protein
MVAHVVLFTPRGDVSSAERQALAAAFELAARTIPTVRSVTIGKQVMDGPTYAQVSNHDADFIAILKFDDLPGLLTYLQHPAHEELRQRFRNVLRSTQVYDFDVGGLDYLTRLV